MPRHDWRNDDDYMTREDRERGYGERDRAYDRRAMFDNDRDSYMRRGRASGWGSLLNDEGSGARDLDPRGSSEYRRDRSFGPDDSHRGLPTDETERLIASNKVQGTPVYGRNGERLGSIHNFMVDKFRGRVVYAVLKHGRGFLGLDERYYPLDWEQLSYDEHLGGYHLDMSEDELTGRGSWDGGERWQERGAMRSGREHRSRYDRNSGW